MYHGPTLPAGIPLHLSSRLFFYKRDYIYSRDVQLHTFAAVGTITPGNLSMDHIFPVDFFSEWTFVASAAGGNKPWLLFGNFLSGTTTTGLIAPDSSFTPGGGFLDEEPNSRLRRFVNPQPPIFYAAVDGRGQVMLIHREDYNRRGDVTTSDLCPVSMCEVRFDGIIIPLSETWIQLPVSPIYSVVGLPVGHVWLYSEGYGRKNSTAYVLLDGQVVSTRNWNGAGWEHVAYQNGAVLFYSLDQQRGEICVLDDKFNLVTTAYLNAPGSSSADPVIPYFDLVASTPTGLLFYDKVGRAGIYRLSSNGLWKTDESHQNLANSWEYIVAC